MAEVHFNEEKHEYRIGSKVVPSVTQIISHYLNPYAGVPRELMEAGAAFGRAVHSMCALYLWGDLDEDTLDVQLVPYLNGFKRFYYDHLRDACITGVEVPLYNQRLRFAGTPDITKMGAVYDIKTRPYNKTTDPIQLAAYEKLSEGSTASLDHFVIEIVPDGYKPTRCNDRQAWPTFRAMLDHWHATKKIETIVNGWRQR